MDMEQEMSDRIQDFLDRFYSKNGPCCAGCDHWRWLNSIAGECTASAPVSGEDRIGMLSLHAPTIPMEAGHIITWRGHTCGDFKDEPL